MEEFLLDPVVCPFTGQSLGQASLRAQTGALLLAIRRSNGELIGGPTADTIFMAGDSLIAMVRAEQLRALNRLLEPIGSRTLVQYSRMGDKNPVSVAGKNGFSFTLCEETGLSEITVPML
jgi:TrkA-C domain